MSKTSNFFERIEEIMAEYSISSVNEFALNYLGYKSSQKINRLKEAGTRPSYEILNDISNKFEEVNAEWLLTGKGEMIKKRYRADSPIKQVAEPSLQYRRDREPDIAYFSKETRPRIPLSASAGSLSIALDGGLLSDCEQIAVIESLSHYDFTIITHGDSMEPLLYSGDELACLWIKDLHLIQWGRVYALDTTNGILVKRIYDNGDYFACHSENNGLYKEFNLHKKNVYNLSLVIGFLRRF